MVPQGMPTGRPKLFLESSITQIKNRVAYKKQCFDIPIIYLKLAFVFGNLEKNKVDYFFDTLSDLPIIYLRNQCLAVYYKKMTQIII